MQWTQKDLFKKDSFFFLHFISLVQLMLNNNKVLKKKKVYCKPTLSCPLWHVMSIRVVRHSPGRQEREKRLNPGSLRQDIHPLWEFTCARNGHSHAHFTRAWWGQGPCTEPGHGGEHQRFWSWQVDFINGLQGPGLACGAERKRQEKEDSLGLKQNPQWPGGWQVTPFCWVMVWCCRMLQDTWLPFGPARPSRSWSLSWAVKCPFSLPLSPSRGAPTRQDCGIPVGTSHTFQV